eukprot:scaffold59704_cov64-Phaeocystis_antarctica.AAC.1
MVHTHEVDHWPKTTMSPYRKCSRRGLARISLGCGTRVPMKSEQKMMFVQKPGSTLQPSANQSSARSPAPHASTAPKKQNPTIPPTTLAGKCSARSHFERPRIR